MADREIKIRNWDKWQTYRNDRGQPPWIKIYRALMHDPSWVALTDAQRGQLVAMWLLAADRRGVIPASPAMLQRICHMDSEPELQVFMEQGFIEHDATVASARRQPDAPEVDVEVDVDTEVERSLVRENADLAPLNAAGTVRALHEHFNTKRGGRALKLTKDRAAKYRSRLNTYSPEELCRAIDVAMEDPFIRGDNDRQTRYDYPETVLKNDASVDRYLDRGVNGRPGHRNFLEKAARVRQALD